MESESIKKCATPAPLHDKFLSQVLGFTASARGYGHRYMSLFIYFKGWDQINMNLVTSNFTLIS